MFIPIILLHCNKHIFYATKTNNVHPKALHIPTCMDGYDTLIVMFQGSIGSLHLMN